MQGGRIWLPSPSNYEILYCIEYNAWCIEHQGESLLILKRDGQTIIMNNSKVFLKLASKWSRIKIFILCFLLLQTTTYKLFSLTSVYCFFFLLAFSNFFTSTSICWVLSTYRFPTRPKMIFQLSSHPSCPPACPCLSFLISFLPPLLASLLIGSSLCMWRRGKGMCMWPLYRLPTNKTAFIVYYLFLRDRKVLILPIVTSSF